MAVIFSTPILKYAKGYLGKIIGDGAIYNTISNALTIALLILCIIVLAGSTYNPFIYFRF